MPLQQSTLLGENRCPQPSQAPQQRILVPLGLPNFQILEQVLAPEGQMEVTIIRLTDRATCPRCQHVSPTCHDRRVRGTREVPLLGRQVSLLLVKRRCWCLTCQRAFTEAATICGWRRRTTTRLRDHLGRCARSRPITHVAAELKGGPRLVQTCLKRVAQAEWITQGRTLETQASLPTPRLPPHR